MFKGNRIDTGRWTTRRDLDVVVRRSDLARRWKPFDEVRAKSGKARYSPLSLCPPGTAYCLLLS
jgi:hypothetical protein